MIYVFLGQGFEEIEALTQVDLLRRAELSVQTVGIGKRDITGSHGITVRCDLVDDDIKPEGLDMVVLPGGMPGTLSLEKSEAVQTVIDYCVQNDKWIGAICAAPSILGHKGLLNGRQAVCFPGYEEQLAGAMLSAEPVCVDGRIITAKGPGVSIEFGLKLVEVLTNSRRAEILKDSLQCRG
ncbi:MAG: DJ-1/PfpI family protein [Ruminococcaceae bacterium]|nr:DJ-1/PfpI family protein [Oscillospiraceae bacterium]